ncbi:MAG: ABC transporter permease [Steroidobacteraceae bacterium]
MSTLAEGASGEQLHLGRIRWVGFKTIVIREYQRIVRIWSQTILPSPVTATLYFVIFGYVIGRRIGSMDGFGYMTYIAPGLIMQAVINNSFSNVVSSFFGAKFGKHIEELLVSPLPSWLIVSGYVSGGVMRGAMVGLVVTAVALFFTHLPITHPVIIACSAILTAVIFALGGFINAMFAKNFDQISIVPTFLLAPLIYLGGVFYSISRLPGWARHLSLVDPLLYMINAFRFGFLGVSDVNVGGAIAIMAVVAVGSFVAAVVLMERGSGIRE